MAKIRKDLLPIKIHFLLFFAGISPIVLFMSTYAKQLGFSALVVGSIFSVLPIAGMVGKMLLGALADKFQCHKHFVIVCIFVALTSFYSLMYVPPLETMVISEIGCGSDRQLFVKMCSQENTSLSEETEVIDNSTAYCKLECSSNIELRKVLCATSPNNPFYCNMHTNTSDEIPEELILLHLQAKLLPQTLTKEGKCASISIASIRDLEDCTNDVVFQHTNTPTMCSSTNSSDSIITTCRMSCDNRQMTNMGTVIEDKPITEHFQLWMFVILMTTGWIGQSVVTSIADTICFAILGDAHSEFGKQRMFGSLGWGLLAMTCGKLVDEFSVGKPTKDYSPVFYITSFLLCLDIIVASQIKKVKKKQSASIALDIGRMLLNLKFLIYLLWCVSMGLCVGLIGNFLFWHLEDLTTSGDRDAMKTLQGLYVIIQAFGGELPFFFLSAWLSNKIGHIHCMSLTLLLFGTLFMVFSVLRNPWYFLPLGVINGMAFSTFYATMTSYANVVAPPGTEATIQGLVSSVFEGVGVSFGSFVAGLLMHNLKGAKVFRLYGTIALALCFIHSFVQVLLEQKPSIESVLEEHEKGLFSDIKYKTPEEAIIITEKPEKIKPSA